jgi:cold shock CspA family protein
MGRSQETFNKKEIRKKKEKKRKDKAEKRQARKDNEKSNSLDDMIAYVDEHGVITSTPPDPGKKEKVKLHDIEVSVPKTDPNQKRDTVRTGKVTHFNSSKGYGFIKDSDTQESVFVHVNNLIDDITEGSKVSYELGSGPKGHIALSVKVIK